MTIRAVSRVQASCCVFGLPFGLQLLPRLTMLLLVSLCIGGCADEHPSVASSDASLSTPFADANWLALLGTDETTADETLPTSLPKDLRPHLRPHPDARAESFSLRAVVVDQQQNTISVGAQWDRLRVRDNATAVNSEWSYDSVYRARAAVGFAAENGLSVKELIERGALGLAGSHAESMNVGTHTIAFTPASSEQPCLQQVALKATQLTERPVVLESVSTTCPVTTSVGGFLNQWEAMAVPFSGSVAGRPVTGHAWLTHTWGQPPPATGAVLLDQLRLRLLAKNGDVTLLNANRSKRRTGKGPVTVLGTALNEQGDSVSVDLQWQDQKLQSSAITGIDYATEFALTSKALSLDVQLVPVVLMSEVVDAFGAQWSGAVQVSGTHSGIGFIDIDPVKSTVTED